MRNINLKRLVFKIKSVIMSRSNINSATTQASSGSGSGNGNISKGQINGTISEFNLKVDDFSSWVERFELYVLLNEILTKRN